MGLKTFTINLAELSSQDSIRLWIPFVLPESKYKYEKINNILAFCESGSRPKGGIKNEDEGEAISLGGEQIGSDGSLNLSKIPYVSFDFFENTTKGKVKDSDILICKDGALTGKTCFVDFSIFPSKEVMINEHVYILRGNENVNQRFLFYYTTTNIFQSQVKDLAFKKKAQPGLNAEHFKKIKIPLIPKPLQDQVIAQIKPIEKKIKELKTQIIAPQEVINAVFAREFGFDLEKFEELKKIKNYYLDLSSFANNRDIRQSVKFHREAGIFVNNQLKKITNKKIKNFISEPIVLGKGVSPQDYDENGDYYYVSMANIKNWQFESEEAKLVSKEYSDQNQNKTVAKNDILIARSGEGTIGKVALIQDEDLRGIFADFTMRIRLQNYNHLFAYYYFRTEYFQYLIEINKKGLGNNTNIFPSQIKEFPMIDISLKARQKIVDEIKAELDKQEEVKKKIEDERIKIDDIIIGAIGKS
jgi:type I restriction enzyme S subunit